MTWRAWAALSRFWATDRGLSILLALLILIVFVLPPIVPVGPLGRLLGDVFFSLMLIAGAGVVSERRWVLVVLLVVVVAALLFRWGNWLAPSLDLVMWRGLSSLATVGLLSLVVLAQVIRRGPVTRQRIEGAVAVYLLLGLTWANAYELVALRYPNAFAGASDVFTTQTWIYYSFVTLTTMGYGDIMPVHSLARSLAVMEALTGQLYPAILLARLVSLELMSSGKG
jgi:hypothetical protein